MRARGGDRPHVQERDPRERARLRAGLHLRKRCLRARLAADLEPYTDHVLASFGWDRVVWGGDWPVCTLSATLARWVAVTHELTKHATEDQRAQLFHRNAERVYRV